MRSDRSGNHYEEGRSRQRRHSISGSKFCMEDMTLSKRRQSDCFMCIKDMEKEDKKEVPSQTFDFCIDQGPLFFLQCTKASKIVVSFDVEKRALWVSYHPPRQSYLLLCEAKEEASGPVPAPPPPKFAVRNAATGVQVVGFYHSLLKRDSKNSCNGTVSDASDITNARSSMIGVIANRTSHLLAIKKEVEFINWLIREVNNAPYKNIDDVVAFMKRLDDEHGFLYLGYWYMIR